MRRFLPYLGFILVAGCGPYGTDVYSEAGSLVGEVVVESGSTARIYDKGGNKIGEVKDEDVFNRSGTRIGEVRDNDDIYDRAGTRKGRISGARCYNRSGSEVGHLSSDIDDEAAGGACFLLFLR
jgi:hypothetical protein